MNCTVGKEIIDNPEATIGFFEQFGNRITFSRMIGKQGISLPDFNAFLNKAMERLNVRTGGYDCTMYGGMCGAGMDNIFYANGKIFICGNCIDLPFSMPYDTPLNEVSFDVIDFDRSCCFKEAVGSESEILRKVFKYFVIYVVIAGIICYAGSMAGF